MLGGTHGLSKSISSSSAAKRTRLNRMKTNFQAKVAEQKDSSRLPLFETLHRELQRRAHPDVLRASHPDKADANDASFQIVNNLLTCVKEGGNTIPDEVGGRFPFYLKTAGAEDGDELVHASLTLDTTGKRKIKASFQEFFRAAGLGDGSGLFAWGNAYYSYPKYEGKRLPRTFKP
jgi:hypothetical protein